MSQPKVEVFSTPICPYCVRAKTLLDRKGVTYEEIDLSPDPELRAQVVQRAGGRTSVPQIFIDGTHVGGSDELYQLESEGKLDNLLRLCG